MFSILLLLSIIFQISSIKIRIGSIGDKNNGEILAEILAMAKNEMRAQRVIDDEFEIEILNVDGCGNSFEGVAAAAKLYHIDKVHAFLGPFCSYELKAVATMAAYWNIPIISYTSTEIQNAQIYRTLIRTSFQTISAITDATAHFLAFNNLTKVSIVSNNANDVYEKVQEMKSSLIRHGIQIMSSVVFEDTSTATELLESGLLNNLKDSSRVIIPIFSSRFEVLSVFKNATILGEMSPMDYIYIYPLMVSSNSDPPVFYGSSAFKTLRNYYEQSIEIYDSNGFRDELLAKFLAIFGKKRVYIDERQLFNYVALYDAFVVLAQSAKMYLKQRNVSRIDGKELRNGVRGRKFSGLNGEFEFNENVDRVTNFNAFYTDLKQQNPRIVSNINTTISSSSSSKAISADTVVTNLVTKYWNSSSGKLPDVNPECGFRNENCDTTHLILLIIATLTLIAMIIGALWMRREWENRLLSKMPWRVLRGNVQLLDEEQTKSMTSLNSGSTKMSQMEAKLVKNHAIIGVNTHAVYDNYEQRETITFNRNDLILLTKMKQAVHDNINPFIGISFNERSELLVLWKFCSRGTLQDAIYSEKFEMDEKFQGAFVRDITLGLEYLHNSPIGFHGILTTWSVLIDKNWMLKLTDYGISDPLKRWEKHGRIDCKIDNESEKKWQKLASLYVPHEIRNSNERNKRNRRKNKWQEQSLEKRKSADVYAFGVIIYEILFRGLPFDEKIDLSELANKAAEGERVTKPSIQRNKKLSPDMIALLQDCWSDKSETRPTIRRVRMATEIALKTKGNLVDSMMRMMEEYANNLEKIVNERTKMAEEANLRAERLLFQLLPKNVAISLQEGKSVPPKLYHSATVMFSDIVGFTKLCSSSSPIEVVGLLNSLYSEFDTVINKHNGYKVETIGDAYMVVSGVPEENGKRHVANIALITLDIIELLRSFEVPHRRNFRLTVRLGFATGPVIAAVIGINSPKYCIFGDTVNTATIMESSGEGGRVQITETSRDLLSEEYPEFITEIRGINKFVKEDEFITYWLIAKDEEYFRKINN